MTPTTHTRARSEPAGESISAFVNEKSPALTPDRRTVSPVLPVRDLIHQTTVTAEGTLRPPSRTQTKGVCHAPVSRVGCTVNEGSKSERIMPPLGTRCSKPPSRLKSWTGHLFTTGGLRHERRP